MYLNHRREPWKDARVRQALALAINREALVNGVMQSQGTPAIGLFPPAMLSCNQLPAHSFDPAKAKQLLVQAGYQDKDGDGYVEKDGQTLTMTLLTYRQRPELPLMAEAIQASLKTVGVKVSVRLAEQIDAALRQGDWDGGLYFFTTSFTGEPYRALSQIFNTSGSANFGGYSSPRVDQLTRQVGLEGNRQAREQLTCAASEAIIDELAVVPLLHPNYNYGVSRKVVGFEEPHRFWFYLMDNKIGKQ
jgi:peptide/nickel transport system substrate-binding protein